MSRVVRRTASVSLIMLMGVSFASVPSLGDGDQSPLMPPQSQAFGKSFEEWNVLWTQRSLEENLGGGTDIPNTVGRVRLLPGDVGNPSPVFDVTLPPGTPFVATPFFVYGERYDDPNVPDDDPIALASVLQQIFADVQVQIVLDGRVLLEGTGADLAGLPVRPGLLRPADHLRRTTTTWWGSELHRRPVGDGDRGGLPPLAGGAAHAGVYGAQLVLRRLPVHLQHHRVAEVAAAYTISVPGRRGIRRCAFTTCRLASGGWDRLVTGTRSSYRRIGQRSLGRLRPVHACDRPGNAG